MNGIEYQSAPMIYTNGAFLLPFKIMDADGKGTWFWRVSEFNNDSYKEGKIFNPPEFAVSKEQLLTDSSFEE